MDRLDTMRAFLAVAEEGGFAAAGRRLGLARANVGRRVADLERALGLRLFERTTQAVRLTAAGERYLPACRDALALVEAAGRVAREEAARPSGLVRLTAPVALGEAALPGAIRRLAQEHPSLALDVELTDRRVDLMHERFDLALRVGEAPKTHAVHPLGRAALRLVAAPGYLERRGAPGAPPDLARHDCLVYALTAEPTLWRLGSASVRVRGPLTTTSGALIVRAAADGLGVALQPDFLVGAALGDGRLVEFLPDHPAPPLPIAALSARGPLPARVTAVLVALRAAVAKGTTGDMA